MYPIIAEIFQSVYSDSIWKEVTFIGRSFQTSIPGSVDIIRDYRESVNPVFLSSRQLVFEQRRLQYTFPEYSATVSVHQSIFVSSLSLGEM